MTATPQASAAYVFVYGTLRQGQLRDITRLQPGLRCVGQGRVAGVLYHLGEYPGLLLADSLAASLATTDIESQVYGELYPLTATLEKQLDVIEEVWPQPNGEYRKRVLPVHCQVGSDKSAVLNALIYEVNLSHTVGKIRIASGDWLDG